MIAESPPRLPRVAALPPEVVGPVTERPSASLIIPVASICLLSSDARAGQEQCVQVRLQARTQACDRSIPWLPSAGRVSARGEYVARNQALRRPSPHAASAPHRARCSRCCLRRWPPRRSAVSHKANWNEASRRQAHTRANSKPESPRTRARSTASRAASTTCMRGLSALEASLAYEQGLLGSAALSTTRRARTPGFAGGGGSPTTGRCLSPRWWPRMSRRRRTSSR